MKKFNLLILGFVIIISSCKRPTNKDLLFGWWQLVEYKIEDPNKASNELLNDIKDKNIYYKSNVYSIYFFDNNRFEIVKGQTDIETKHFKLVDRKNIEDANGIFISIFFMSELEMKLNKSSINIGPYEILSLTKDELILKDRNTDVLNETKGLVSIKFKKLKR